MTSSRMMLSLLAALVIALGATGCGQENDDHGAGTSVRTAANGDEYNEVDVDFATGMIPHHADALQMADLAEGRPLSRETSDLVSGIREAQTQEIETMTAWLTDWDKEVPATGRDHVNAGHGEHAMASADLEKLEKASDGEFERMWLEMMVEHHEDAVTMAKEEQADGHFPAAVDLAAQIERAQSAEIEQMKGLVED